MKRTCTVCGTEYEFTSNNVQERVQYKKGDVIKDYPYTFTATKTSYHKFVWCDACSEKDIIIRDTDKPYARLGFTSNHAIYNKDYWKYTETKEPEPKEPVIRKRQLFGKEYGAKPYRELKPEKNFFKILVEWLK